MYIHPHIGGQIGTERQRDMLARAEHRRLTRQLRARSRASRHARQSSRPIRRILRPAFWLRTQARA
jgi:hypothetical protein